MEKKYNVTLKDGYNNVSMDVDDWNKVCRIATIMMREPCNENLQVIITINKEKAPEEETKL